MKYVRFLGAIRHPWTGECKQSLGQPFGCQTFGSLLCARPVVVRDGPSHAYMEIQLPQAPCVRPARRLADPTPMPPAGHSHASRPGQCGTSRGRSPDAPIPRPGDLARSLCALTFGSACIVAATSWANSPSSWTPGQTRAPPFLFSLFRRRVSWLLSAAILVVFVLVRAFLYIDSQVARVLSLLRLPGLTSLACIAPTSS